ncbi:MAG: hypothetical protein IK122_04100 [Alphaproteobacteria bacterium]|nr:hypothetical protein [Alphaproteobacteria bacterium]
MAKKQFPSNTEFICKALNQRCYRDNDLFSETACYWKLSDLALLFPYYFDVKTLVPYDTIRKINKDAIDSIPEFRELVPQPVHVLKIKESYNIYANGKLEFVKNGSDQKLSRVACEHLFRQKPGAEIQQAYFMFPNQSIQELNASAQKIHFERARDSISASSNILSAIINRAIGSTKYSFRDVWAEFWRTLYAVNSLEDFRNIHNIKTSPIDYMPTQTLVFINGILQEIISQFCNKDKVYIQEIINMVHSKASYARAEFIKYGALPETKLTNTNSYYQIVKMRKLREKFWREHYPLSLQVR